MRVYEKEEHDNLSTCCESGLELKSRIIQKNGYAENDCSAITYIKRLT